MKKAKLMLSALGICAVLATTFAFKAQMFQIHKVYTGTTSTDCTHEVFGRIITTVGSILVYASTQSITVGCTQTYTAISESDLKITH
jgi:hypothetical protein